MIQRLAILGSTGSIGVNALRVVSQYKDRFKVVALAADTNVRLLAAQARAFRPKAVCVGNAKSAVEIRRALDGRIELLCGTEGLEEIVSRPDVDTVVMAIGGGSALIPIVRAVENGKRIALANKESLVAAGALITKLARRHSSQIVPVDSEHSAIFQCLEGRRKFARKIYLTASGGPLLNVPARRFARLSQRDILNHPKWRMGKKISVDSATMMNKGLEIIEARWLFDIDEKDIDVLIHPEAIIHSMVEFVDGAVFAHMSAPDMRLPIQYALTYPDRARSMVKAVDFLETKKLTFLKPDVKKFPCLGLAREALRKSGTHPAVLTASDEEAVCRYLNGDIAFTDIPKIVEKVLARHKGPKKEPTIGDILAAGEWAQQEVQRLCYR